MIKVQKRQNLLIALEKRKEKKKKLVNLRRKLHTQKYVIDLRT